MNETKSLLNLYFPNDISKMILEMVYKAEHEDKYEVVLYDLQINHVHQMYDKLIEHLEEKSVYQEVCVNGTFITHMQPQGNINQMVLEFMTSYDDVSKMLKVLSKCTCCPRHSNNKPDDLHADPRTYILHFDAQNNIYHPAQNENKSEFKKAGKTYFCNCTCRKIARMLLISHNNIFHMNSLYYRKVLLYNYHKANNKLEYYNNNIEKIKTDPQSRKHKRKTYHKLKRYKKDVEIFQKELSYDLAYLQYHMTVFPHIEHEEKYKVLYDKIPITNIRIQVHG